MTNRADPISHECRDSDILPTAKTKASSAFFTQLRQWPFGATEVIGPVSERDRSTLLPALELYLNGCAALPDAHTLCSHGLAGLKHAEIVWRNCTVSVTTLEATDALQIFVEEIIERYHGEAWFVQLCRGVLSYVANDDGQGVCSTLRLVEFAIASEDAELLDVLVDAQSRKPFFRITPPSPQPDYEMLRLEAANNSGLTKMQAIPSSWSGIAPRRRASVLGYKEKAQNSIVAFAHERLEQRRVKWAMSLPHKLSVKQSNFLRELAGVTERETVVSGGLKKPLTVSAPSYAADEQLGEPKPKRKTRSP